MNAIKLYYDIKLLFFDEKRIFITFRLFLDFLALRIGHGIVTGGEPHILQNNIGEERI